MPLQKLQFRPGVNREGTTLSNEGGWYDCDKVRFRSGYPEKVGGWQRDGGTPYATAPTGTFAANGTSTSAVPSTGVYWGIAKALWNWINLTGYNLLAVGTNLKYYIQNSVGGNYNDVTPIRLTNTATASAFTTATSTNSGGYTTITVTDAGHGAQANDFVNITPLNTTLNGAINSSVTSIVLTSATGFPATGSIFIDSECITYTGISTNTLTGCTRGTNGTTAASHLTLAAVYATPNEVKILGEYQIVTYVSSSQYTILVLGTATASSTPAVSGTFNYQLTTGNTTFTYGTGWGAGGWSGVTTGYASTGWGSPAPAGLGIGVQLRLWSQSNYGEDLVFNPRGGAMYYWANNSSPNVYDRGQIIKANPSATPTLYGVTIKNGSGGTTTFYPDSTCPSVANFVLVSDASRFTFAFGCNDPTGVYATTTQDPMQIRWSDQNTVATWTPAITNQAGGIRLSHGSTIVTAIQTRQEILVITDAAIYSFQYLGAPYVWSTQLLADNISIASPNAVAVVNNVTYWMGADKFYMYSGRVETLPCALRQYIYGNINLTEAFQIHCGTNEGYNEIWWFYPSQTGTTSDGDNGTGTAGSPNTLIDRYVIYNHLERTWYYGTMNGSTVRPRTAWLDSPLRAEPTAAIGYTANNASGIPVSYTNGAVVYHETTVDNNETSTPVAIDSYVQSSDFDIGDGHNFGFVWRLIPDLTFDGSTSTAPAANFTVRPRAFPGTNYGTSNDPSVISANSYVTQTTYNVQQFTQQVYVRIRGRQMAFKISSSDLGTQWQLGAPRIDVRPDGRR
jgi:hypothetical protein